MRKRILSVLLSSVLCINMTVTALGAYSPPDLEAAVAYVLEQGIMVGDQDGNMNLGSGMNRAELAALLTRMCGGVAEMQSNFIYYSQSCQFPDVPAWAVPYVGYCVRNNLVTGYDALHYGAGDPVNPAAACTVILRACGIEDGGGNIWNYSTACSYAVSLGWMDEPTARASVMTRGEMAVLIYRALGTRSENTPDASQGIGGGYLTNGKPISEENVLELLRQIEMDWPTGTVWGTHNTPGTHKNEIPSTVSNRVLNTYKVSGEYGCGAYASMISSLVFGDKTNPARRVDDLLQIRPGDILLFVRNSDRYIWHVIVVLESPSEIHAFHYTDGNNGQKVYWPDRQNPYGRENLDCFGENKEYHLEAWTRYPENVPYSGNSIGAWPTGS